jgi:hypothetical protein
MFRVTESEVVDSLSLLITTPIGERAVNEVISEEVVPAAFVATTCTKYGVRGSRSRTISDWLPLTVPEEMKCSVCSDMSAFVDILAITNVVRPVVSIAVLINAFPTLGTT